MNKNGSHLFKRQYVRLKGWLTLGSIGIVPRLIIAFASVAALAATANLIVEKGVAIVEQQRNVALERSAQDAQQITALRESMSRARRAALSAGVLGALGEFDRAAQEHADLVSAHQEPVVCHAPDYRLTTSGHGTSTGESILRRSCWFSPEPPRPSTSDERHGFRHVRTPGA